MTGRERSGRPMCAAAGALLLTLGLTGSAAAENGDAGEADGPQPYELAEDVEAIEGTPGSAESPLLQVGAVYHDTLGPGDELYYRVELDDKSDFYLSVVAAPEPGSSRAMSDRYDVELQTTAGDTCDSNASRSFGSGDDRTRPLGAAAFRIVDRERDCQEGGDYLLAVERDDGTALEGDDWQTELRVVAEPPASGTTDAPPEDEWLTADELPAAASGEATDVTGGTGFNDAQPIGEGVWRDSLTPGQTRFYRVPVDWHQQLSVVAEAGNTPTDDEDSLGGFVSNGFSVELYTPFQALAHPEETTSYAGDQERLLAMTAPVAYDNRYDTDEDVEPARVPGWYYVAIHLHSDVEDIVGESAVGVTLRADLHGAAAEGPDYAGDFTETGFGVSADDRQQAAEGKDDATVAAEQRDAQLLLGFSAIGVGLVLVLALGAWLGVARRRAAATAPGGPVAGGGAGPGAGPVLGGGSRG